MSPSMPVFISYSRHDSAFVRRLSEDLKSMEVDIWLDRIDIPVGYSWDREIEQALKRSTDVIVVMSSAAVSSEHVLNEIEFAVSAGKRLIPILIPDCDTPLRICRIHQIDFRKDYQSGMNALVGALATPVDPIPVAAPAASSISSRSPSRP